MYYKYSPRLKCEDSPSGFKVRPTRGKNMTLDAVMVLPRVGKALKPLALSTRFNRGDYLDRSISSTSLCQMLFCKD